MRNKTFDIEIVENTRFKPLPTVSSWAWPGPLRAVQPPPALLEAQCRWLPEQQTHCNILARLSNMAPKLHSVGNIFPTTLASILQVVNWPVLLLFALKITFLETDTDCLLNPVNQNVFPVPPAGVMENISQN